jgi:PKD repeat protein
MGFTQQEAEDFYYYTINAAAASSIHFMTASEIDQYKIRSCVYSSMPNYSVSLIGDELIADLSGVSYQWIDCNNNTSIPTETNQSYTIVNNGSYAVIVTETACSDTSACITINNLGITENPLKQVNVYPNPSTGLFTIDFDGNIDEVVVIDALGRLIELEVDELTWEIDGTFLANGKYTLLIKTEQNVFRKELIVLK